MQFNKTSNLSFIGLAAALAGGAAYYMSSNGVRVRKTIDNNFALDKTTEIARVSPNEMMTGAAVTVLLAGVALWGYRKDWSGVKARLGRGGQERVEGGMHGIQQIEETLDLDVPVSMAYNQWTQFEEFPRFMPTVESVKQVDDSHLHWRANVGGKVKEWDSEITQQIPDQLIEWKSTSGPRNGGTVTFDKLKDNKTRVRLVLWYQPETKSEKIGALFGGVKMTAKGNLKRFKQLLERRGMESGAWRGEISPQH